MIALCCRHVAEPSDARPLAPAAPAAESRAPRDGAPPHPCARRRRRRSRATRCAPRASSPSTCHLQVNQNQSAFQELLQSADLPELAAPTAPTEAPAPLGAPGGAPGGGVVQIQLTQEEAAAVGRLQGLGFSEDDALQAYLACEKNEELAANLLFDG